MAKNQLENAVDWVMNCTLGEDFRDEFSSYSSSIFNVWEPWLENQKQIMDRIAREVVAHG